MTCALTRRQVMRLFCITIPAALFSSSGLNIFADERICVHVFELNNPIPEPLLTNRNNRTARSKNKHYFQSGLPELIVCTSRIRFLDLFEYFWPLSSEEFRSMQKATDVKFTKPGIFSSKDVEELSRYLSENNPLTGSRGMTSAVLLTLNDYTINWVSEVVQICRKSKVKELVIFKDPARPPYLCSYPAQQKGFKRPPPIGSSQS